MRTDEDEWANDTDDLDDDRDAPRAEDVNDEETLTCPECGATVYDDMDECPHCYAPLTNTAMSHGPRSPFMRVGVLLAILVVVALSIGYLLQALAVFP